MQQHPVVSREEWLLARKELLAKEKEFTRLRDQLSAERRELPWVKVDQSYTFEGPGGPLSLADLFDGRSQLIVYHFMLAPGWEEGCPGCSFLCDHIDGTLIHLAHRDVTLKVVSRASTPEIEAFKKRMEWKFDWVSSFGSDFNFDYHVSFKKDQGPIIYNYEQDDFFMEELPGISVFYKDSNGAIFHTYSSYARGGEALIGTYTFLDLVPKGRDEDFLDFPMAWLRHHDKYDDNYKLDPKAQYEHPKESKSECCSKEH